jgi:holo-[acyl-carrier protein] synthase
MIGIDLTDTQRLAQRLERTAALAEELFHAGERAYCDRQRDPAQHLAARFAAKEAVIKALGIDGFDPLDVEVVDGGECCGVVLHGAAAARADELDVTVSISMTHLPEVAGAVAMARPRQST